MSVIDFKWLLLVLSFKMQIIILSVWVLCLNVFMRTTCIPGTHGGQERVSNSQQLAVQTVVTRCD